MVFITFGKILAVTFHIFVSVPSPWLSFENAAAPCMVDCEVVPQQPDAVCVFLVCFVWDSFHCYTEY